MKKKRAIRNIVLVSLFVVIVALLSFISFPVPGTNYTFKGFANLHGGLELDGGVKNTFQLEVADWFDGSDSQAYRKAVDRVQELLDKHYADAKVYLSGDNEMTVEVPDTHINNNYLVGFIEMKSAEGAEAEAMVTGQDIESVEYLLNGTIHGVYIQFSEEGKEKFRELTKTVSGSENQTMYIYMNKNYEQAFSQTTVTEENNSGVTFISGASITNKESGQEYANKIQSATLGINMTTEQSNVEIGGTFGKHTRLVITIVTIVAVVASIAIAFVLFRDLGLMSTLSLLFALMTSVLIAAMFDLQVTFVGWLGFMFGYFLNFLMHMYYLGVIKKEFAMGKKYTVSFTSGYKKALFNMLDILLITTGILLLILIVPSNLVRAFSFNALMTLAGTAFTALYLNKVLAVNYSALNKKDYKRIKFVREEVENEN